MSGPVRRRRVARPSNGGIRLITVLIALLFAVPSNLVVPALGSAGTPALLVGLAMLAGFLFPVLSSGYRPALDPIRIAMLLFVAAVLASYIAAATRPIDPVEVRAADRGVLTVLAWLGVVLLVSEAPRSHGELDTVLRRVSIAGGLLGALGIAQFLTGQSFVEYLHLPGLVQNSDVAPLARSSFNRPAGTTIHPIEFGAVLTTVLPLALHYAIHDRDRSRVGRMLPLLAIAVAIPLSISRSALISASVVLLIMLPAWPARMRRQAYAVVGALGVLMYLAIPGLIGTITNLFTGLSSDSSAASRTNSYSLAFSLIGRAPVFGRGFKTFLPEYRILDNQYLGSLIELGVVGTVALLGLLICTARSDFVARRADSDPVHRHLGVALAAAVITNAVSLAFYDGFGFPMAACLLFLVIGAGSAFRRIQLAGPDLAPEPAVPAAAFGGRSTAAGGVRR